MAERFGILLRVDPGAGVLHQQTGVIAEHRANISSVDILEETEAEARVYFEVDMEGDSQPLLDGLKRLAVVREVSLVKTMDKIYGKRIIIVGGGAQVGQVAIGAISEADRHNIRGEHISVDTSSPSRKPCGR